MNHFQRLERMYADAPINRFFQPEIQIAEGRAEVRMTVRPDMHHSAAAAHGAVYFKMLDDAAFFATQSLVPDTFMLTVAFNAVFLAPVTDGQMLAVGTVVHQSRRLVIAESVLTVDARVVARGNGTFMRSAKRLDGDTGYR